MQKVSKYNLKYLKVVQCLVLEEFSTETIEDLEAALHFCPTKGNVIFSSAIHGYAFELEDFADIYSERLKISKSKLTIALFGDYYIAGGKVKSDAASRGKLPLFVQLILDPLWSLHDCGLVSKDLNKLLELTGKLGLTVKSSRTPDAFDEAMRLWLPVARACFRCCSRAPSSRTTFINKQRMKYLIGNRTNHPLEAAIQNCSRTGTTVVLVAKFIFIEGRRFAVCRILSGQVAAGNELYLIGKKTLTSGTQAKKVTIYSVCALRGRDLIPLKTATAGVICAIEAQGLVQNTTLCSEADSEGLNVSVKQAEPLVRISVSTVNLEDMERLKEELKTLSILDSSLRVLELDNGELAMVTAGEVHLQKCLKDLEDLGFNDLEISKPIVPFLETVVADKKIDVCSNPGTSHGIFTVFVECKLRGDALYIRLRVVPLPDSLVTLLEESADLLNIIKRGNMEELDLVEFRSKLQHLCEEHLPLFRGSWWYKKSVPQVKEMVDNIWSFGPDRARANVLFNAISNYNRKSIWDCKSGVEIHPLDQAIISGFELFVSAGPLCHEVMRGVGVIVEEWTFDEKDVAVAGQLMAAMRSTCQVAAKKLALRLVAAMYRCTVTTAVQALGKVHGVLAQRKGKVLNEDINDATGLFEVTALVPVIETFSFCDHLRKSTSGMASAQLEFSHWQLIDEDPYWQPTTLEEMEEYGVKGDSPNHARGYMDAIRRRKGLPTDDVIVISAEKQRNLKKNK
ncbi:elongation factor G [Dictyocaulus viviparus]|uniref:Elongation factor-like 1 n=1 Tax=Dictyocaulus viviparus TaxID=29172 RepID=A0A0D8XRJ7_DICVI|nr:elongation factor G [Dictyocaulus viviparus]